MTVKLNLKLHLRNTNKYENEEKYNIEITDEDFAKAVNVYEIAELIYKNTALCEAGEGSAAVRRIVRFEEMPAAKKFQAKK